jgi:hypothetical protein
LRRLDEQAEIVVLERDRCVWFANCGLPYHIGGADPGPGQPAAADAGEPPGPAPLSHSG